MVSINWVTVRLLNFANWLQGQWQCCCFFVRLDTDLNPIFKACSTFFPLFPGCWVASLEVCLSCLWKSPIVLLSSLADPNPKGVLASPPVFLQWSERNEGFRGLSIDLFEFWFRSFSFSDAKGWELMSYRCSYNESNILLIHLMTSLSINGWEWFWTWMTSTRGTF